MRVLRIVVSLLMVVMLLSTGVFANKNYAEKIENLLMEEEMTESVNVAIDGENVTIVIWLNEIDEGLLKWIQDFMIEVFKIYPFDSLIFEIYVDGMPVLSFETSGQHVSDYLDGKLTLEAWADLMKIVDLVTQKTITVEELQELLIVINQPVTEEVVEEPVEEVVEEPSEVSDESPDETGDMVDTEEADASEEEEMPAVDETSAEEEAGMSAFVYVGIALAVVALAGLGWWIYKKRT